MHSQHRTEIMPQSPRRPPHRNSLIQRRAKSSRHTGADTKVRLLVIVKGEVHGTAGVGEEAVVDARVGLADGHELAAEVVVLLALGGGLAAAAAARVDGAVGGCGGCCGGGGGAGDDVVGRGEFGEEDVDGVVGYDGEFGVAGEVEGVGAEGAGLQRDCAEAGDLGVLVEGSGRGTMVMSLGEMRLSRLTM
jgi:hypothetical protein